MKTFSKLSLIIAVLIFSTAGIINRVPRSHTAGVPWDVSSNTTTQLLCDDNLETTAVVDVEGTNGTSSTNTTNLHIAGPFGTGAFDFTAASSEYVNMNQAYQATIRAAFNISFWMKPNDGQPASQFIFWGVNDGGTADGINMLLQPDGKMRFYIIVDGNDVYALTDAVVFADGSNDWTHVVVNVSATQIDIYINSIKVTLDGTQDGNLTSASVVLGDYTATLNPFLGAWNNSGTPIYYLDGGLKDFRVHDRVIIQDEINGIYNGGSGTEDQSGN